MSVFTANNLKRDRVVEVSVNLIDHVSLELEVLVENTFGLFLINLEPDQPSGKSSVGLHLFCFLVQVY